MPSRGSRLQYSCSSEFDKEQLSSLSDLFHLPEYSDWFCWARISPLTPRSIWRDGAVIGQPGRGRGYNLLSLTPTALRIPSAEVSVRKHVWQRQCTSTAHPEVKAWQGALAQTRGPGSPLLHSGRQGWRGLLCSPPPGSHSLHSENSSALFLILCSSYFSWRLRHLWVWVSSVLNDGPYRTRPRDTPSPTRQRAALVGCDPRVLTTSWPSANAFPGSLPRFTLFFSHVPHHVPQPLPRF